MKDVFDRLNRLSPEKRAILERQLAQKTQPSEQHIQHQSGPGPFPLSFAQERLWFLDQLEPGNAAYNLPVALRLRGRLDVSALERSLNTIVERHQILRTMYLTEDGQPVQYVRPYTPFSLHARSLAGATSEQREAELERLATAEAGRPFDLEQGSVFRVTLLQKSAEEHVLLLTFHHIAFDGWSVGLFNRELSTAYAAYSAGQPAHLPELAIQYTDFAVDQRRTLQGDALEQQLAYWQKQLAQLPSTPLELPTDYPRPALLRFQGARHEFALPLYLTRALQALSRSEDVTLFMLLLAAFYALLHHYTQQSDIPLGTPQAIRRSTEVEDLMGLFVNTLVLRGDVSGNPRFRTLLKRVREMCWEAYNHQDVPFEKIVEKIQPERNLSYNPLFQVIFALQNMPRGTLVLPDLSIESTRAETKTTMFDLRLLLMESEEGLGGILEYNSELFTATTIQYMVQHFQIILESIVAHPDQRIADLNLLTKDERHLLLQTWNTRAEPFQVDACLHELFAARAAQSPDAPAVHFNDHTLTYQALNRQADHLARALQDYQVGPEAIIGVAMERSLELIVTILAILKAGGAYLPLDPHYPAERLNVLIEDAHVSLILTDQASYSQMTQLRGLVLDCAELQARTFTTSARTVPPAQPENLAYVIYTSGSTGTPKGVMISHAHVVRLFLATRHWFDWSERDIWTLFHSYAFDFSVWELWGALSHGGQLVVVPYWVSRTPTLFATLLKERAVTILNQTPSAFTQLLRMDEQTLARDELSLRAVIFGGEALHPHLLARWADTPETRPFSFVNMYGITETTVHATYRRLKSADIFENERSVIGTAIPDLQMYILNPSLQPVPIGIVGELYIGGAGVARGYLLHPELTAERFLPHPFSTQPGARLYQTGDLARYLPNGEIEYIGRADTQVKIRGFRIEPGEIESALIRLPDVQEALVTVHTDTQANKHLVAYLVPGPQANLSVSTIRHTLQNMLPDYMIPAYFITLPALPLTQHGKVDRRALPPPSEVRPLSEHTYVAPETPQEVELARIWSQVLGIEHIGLHDNFFELGGDSLRTIQVRSLAQKADMFFSVQQFFQHQSIAELLSVLRIEQPPEDDTPSLSPFQLVAPEDHPHLPDGLDDAYPMTLLQLGMIFHGQYNAEEAARAYHDVFSLQVQARFEASRLSQAIQHLLRRHAILRTSFELSRFSEPMQLVHKEVPLPLQSQDLRSLMPEQQAEVLRAWTTAQQKHSFAVTQAPLFRFQAHWRTDESFQLTLSFHHAILDGWSVASLITELLQAYQTLLSTECDLPDTRLASSFRDFVYQEQLTLRSQACQEYWQRKLENYTRLTLPSWTPLSMTEEADQPPLCYVALSPATTKGLRHIASSARVPLKSVLLAAHMRVMSLLSGQRDILTGVVINGRIEGNDGESVPGLFLNTVPFRLQLEGGSWEQLALQVFAAEQEFWPYRRYPLAQMQKERGGAPLFDIYFDYRHFHVYQRLEALDKVGIVDGEFFEKTNFMLTVNFNQALSREQLSLTLKYDATKLSRAQVSAISEYYITTLNAMATQPSQRYETALLLPERDRRLVVEQWNDTALEYPQEGCVHHLFEEQAQRTPDAIAVVYEDVQLTYGELNDRANQLANFLQQQGIQADTLAGLLLERSPDMVIGALAILKAGGAYVPLDPRFPPERLRFIVEDANIRVLLTRQHLSAKLAGLPIKSLFLDQFHAENVPDAGKNPRGAVCAANLAYVIYTSGSTGRPKGVMISHRNVLNFFAGMRQRIDADERAHWLAVTSISFDISVLELFWPLTRGQRVIIQSDRRSKRASLPKAPHKTLDFSLFYFANSAEMSSSADKYRLLLESARFADTHDFAAVWTPERHFHPFGGLYPNPSVISAALATITKRVAIRAGSVVLPLHHPLRVAEEWSVVDNLSQGRVGLSFASGWHANDFVLFPEHYATRRTELARTIETVRKLWRGEAVSYRNGAGNLIETKIFPRPLQPELPIWLTSTGSPETFQLAGQLGTNLLTHLLGQSVEDLGEKIKLYREAWHQHGHAEGGGKITLMLHTFVDQDAQQAREQVRQPLRTYLKSSWNLLQGMAEGLGYGKDKGSLSEQDMEALLDHAFERYYEAGGLLGTPEACLAMIERLKAIDIDEIACMIDFGVDVDAVLASLPHLDSVIQQSRLEKEAEDLPPAISPLIEAQGISHLQVTPSLARIMLTEPAAPQALGRLRKLLVGGEALPAPLAQQLSRELTGSLYNMYGPTETTIWSTTRQMEAAETTVSIGHPIINTQSYILDASLQPVPPGVVGHLYLGGDGLARGYLNHPDLTAEHFIPDPFRTQPGARLYQTGDIARHLPDGTLELLGRSDFQVKIRGYRIELGEIEAALQKHPDVHEAAVTAWEDAQGDKRLIAYVVPTSTALAELASDNSPEHPQASELHIFLARDLPDYMLPIAFVRVAALPLTPNGKLDRQALPAPDLQRVMREAPYIAPTTALEETLVRIWSEIIGVEHIGMQDNFFDLGGDSIKAVRLMDRIHTQLGVNPSLAMLFKYPTIARLAETLHKPEPESTLVPLATRQVREQRIFLIHPLGGHIFCYNPLAQAFQHDFTIYGLQARGFDGKQPPFRRIEDMAAYYIQEIINVQPAGPYIIGGWCMGGTVAFEVARQLQAQGRLVALTALISSDADHPTDARLANDRVATLLYALGLLQVPMEASIAEKLDGSETAPDLIDQLTSQHLMPADIEPERVRVHMNLYQTHAKALLSYQPQPYSGSLVVLRPEEDIPGEADQDAAQKKSNSAATPGDTRSWDLGWEKLARGGVEVIALPGHHYSMMRSPHVEKLANVLESLIQRASFQQHLKGQ